MSIQPNPGRRKNKTGYGVPVFIPNPIKGALIAPTPVGRSKQTDQTEVN